MTTTDISIFSLAVGLLLLLVPLYFFRLFKTSLVKATLIATARMVVQLFLIGLYLKYLFLWNNPLINILWVLVMVVVAASTAIRRTGLKPRVLFLPVATGFLSAAILVGMYFLVFVLGLKNPFDARYFIPIMGILLGNMLGVNVLSLSTFYDGVKRERPLFDYLLGNGATRLESLTPFIRQAIEKSFMPCIANMAVMGLVSLPGTMIGQILGGSSPDVAIKYQMMIIVITFSASMVSLMITLWLSGRYAFDAYGRLRDMFQNKH